MFEEITYQLVEWVSVSPLWLVYGVFFLIAYAENVIPPIPGDVLVAFAGYLAAEGLVRVDLMLVGTSLASMAGFMTLYQLGARLGDGITAQRHAHWVFRFIPFEHTERARRWMQRSGPPLILANRFLAGTRTVISLISGISHVPARLAIPFSTISAFLWNAILLAGGWMVRENWEQVGAYINTYGAGVLVALIAYAVWQFIRHRRLMGVDITPKKG